MRRSTRLLHGTWLLDTASLRVCHPRVRGLAAPPLRCSARQLATSAAVLRQLPSSSVLGIVVGMAAATAAACASWCDGEQDSISRTTNIGDDYEIGAEVCAWRY
jgi:hypothetical protein